MGPLPDEPARLIPTLNLCFPFSGCYPSMPRPHLARAAELMRAYCAEQKIPYTETTLLASYANIITYLNKVGLSGRDPFECPMVSAYRPS